MSLRRALTLRLTRLEVRETILRHQVHRRLWAVTALPTQLDPIFLLMTLQLWLTRLEKRALRSLLTAKSPRKVVIKPRRRKTR
jgi:hypothetical protein